MTPRSEAMWTNRVRGLVLGLAVGDAIGTDPRKIGTTDQFPGGVSTQLAAFTLDGLIRAHVRFAHKGICHPPTVVWHAYCRWAFLQGLEPDAMRQKWGKAAGDGWPDGWLVGVPTLRQRRGNAPATVKALRALHPGTAESPTTTSAGAHAVTRTLPTAAALSRGNPKDAARMAGDLAAQTHGAPEAQGAAALASFVAAHVIAGTPINDAVELSFGASIHDMGPMLIDQIQTAGAKYPGRESLLAEFAPKATAAAAVVGGLYAALSFPRREQIEQGLRFAATAPDPDSVCAVTGAFLGASHGADALPVNLISRLELAWVMDTLARDLATETLSSPSGGWGEPGDNEWFQRYPGW